MALIYLAVMAFFAAQAQDLSVILWEFPVFGAMVLPGMLFVGAFAVVVPAVMPVSLYAILYTGYWFWGNLLPPTRLPTISCTPLTPIGGYVQSGLFGDPSVCALPIPGTPAMAWASIALLLGCAGLALIAGQTYLRWRESHQ